MRRHPRAVSFDPLEDRREVFGLCSAADEEPDHWHWPWPYRYSDEELVDSMLDSPKMPAPTPK